MTLHALLEGLVVGTDAAARRENDPVRFAHRYRRPVDIEVAAFLAAGLAYGRVAGFGPAIAKLLDHADASGGPSAWVLGFDPRHPGEVVEHFMYRFNRGPDLALVVAGLRDLLDQRGSIGAWVDVREGEPHVGPALARWIDALRAAVLRQPGAPASWAAASGGLRHLLPTPADGSATKRLCMFTRWMVRRADGVDLGLWSHIDPARLVVPLDTHVHRIARLTGLTARRDASWRTAVEVTASLARFDPADPVRFDFALAHLGISDGCDGTPRPPVCGACPLRPACRIGAAT